MQIRPIFRILAFQIRNTLYNVPVSNPSGWLYYVPEFDYYGDTDSLVYNVADIYGQLCNGTPLIFDVAHVDQAPTVGNQDFLQPNNTVYGFDLVIYDADDAQSTLSIHFTSVPTNGVLYPAPDFSRPDYPTNAIQVGTTLPGDLTDLTYILNTHFAYGTNFDSFSYYLSDPSGSNSAVATVTINVQDVQQPPVSTTPTNFILLENSSNNITFTGSDPFVNKLYFFVSRLPAPGRLIFNGDLDLANYTLPVELTVNPGVNPVVEYIPDTNYAGMDSFAYTVGDAWQFSPGEWDQPVPCSITLDVAQTNEPPVISGQTAGVTVHVVGTGKNVSQDGIIDSLVVTDPVSQTNGWPIALTIQSLDEGADTSLYATATSTVTVTNVNNYTLQVQGLPNDINALIATNHIFYHPTVTTGRAHLVAIANNEGNTAYGPVAPPQQTTNTIPVSFVNP